jgi:hypothetical protein
MMSTKVRERSEVHCDAIDYDSTEMMSTIVRERSEVLCDAANCDSTEMANKRFSEGNARCIEVQPITTQQSWCAQ